MLWKKQLEGERVGFSPQSRGTAHRAWEVRVEELRGSWSSQPVRNQGDGGRLASVQLHFLLHLRDYYTLLVCIVCLCVHTCIHLTAHMWGAEDNLWEQVLSFQCVGSWNLVIRLRGKNLGQLSHLPGPVSQLLYSPDPLTREWCHLQWTGLPTSVM